MNEENKTKDKLAELKKEIRRDLFLFGLFIFLLFGYCSKTYFSPLPISFMDYLMIGIILFIIIIRILILYDETKDIILLKKDRSELE